MLTSAAPANDDLLIKSLLMEKETFWLNNIHLLPAEIEQRWDVRAAQIRSILGPSPSQSFNLQTSVPRAPHYNAQYTHMVRSRSDQPAPRSLDRSLAISHAPATMSRKRSNGSESTISPFTSNGKPISPLTIANYQSGRNDPFTPWTMPSPSKIQRTASGRSSLPQVPEIAVYDNPEDFIRQTQLSGNFQSSQTSPGLRPQRPRRASHLSISPGKASPLSSSLASSLPSTAPTTSGLSDATTFVSNMSRQSSQATNSLCGAFDMVRLQSQYSDISDLSIDENPNLVESSLDMKKSRFPNFDQSHFVDHTGGITQNFDISPVNLLPLVPLSDVASSSVEREAKMNRSSSAESNTSSPTSASRRRHKQPLHSERHIAPKLSDEQISISRQSSSSGHQVIRIHSADGLVKDVMPISKQQCTRPSREKVRCDKCNYHAVGFRGEHELRRHTDRAHSTLRRVWVCVDTSPDKTMLANCKACCHKKMYGAYYNAAAHLRRVHFNPKPKGRNNKGKAEERRGGKGGGDDPPMEYLKKNWMKEVEEYVPHNVVPPYLGTTKTPLFDSENVDSDENQYDFGDDFTATQPQTTLFIDTQTLATPSSDSMPGASFLNYGGELPQPSQSAAVSSTLDDLGGSFDLSMMDSGNNFDELMFGNLDFSPSHDQDPSNFGGYDNNFFDGP